MLIMAINIIQGRIIINIIIRDFTHDSDGFTHLSSKLRLQQLNESSISNLNEQLKLQQYLSKVHSST